LRGDALQRIGSVRQRWLRQETSVVLPARARMRGLGVRPLGWIEVAFAGSKKPSDLSIRGFRNKAPGSWLQRIGSVRQRWLRQETSVVLPARARMRGLGVRPLGWIEGAFAGSKKPSDLSIRGFRNKSPWQ